MMVMLNVHKMSIINNLCDTVIINAIIAHYYRPF